jgi:dihydroorotase
MTSFFLKGARVVHADGREPVLEHLRVEDGIITAIGPDLEPGGDLEVVDAAGMILLPGLCDVHVHIREPGREDCETIQSATRAARAGGFTRICSMPNTYPPIDTGGMVTYVKSISQSEGIIPVSVSGCLTVGREGEKLAEIGDMVAKGAVMVTDCNRPLQDPYVLRRALEYSRTSDVVVAVYPDTPALSLEGVMNEGEVSFRLGLPGIPAVSEEIAVERDLRLAQAVGGRIHIQNVSTAKAVASVRRFKAEGVAVTAEVTPHHLLLTEESVEGYNTHTKMMPPLRTAADREALREGLRDGTLDMMATGHAPHTDFEKNLDFQHAPFGIIGLESALPACYEGLVKPGELSWSRLAEAFSHAPRALLKEPALTFQVGSRLNAVLFDPEGETRIARELLHSKSFNSPWLNQTLQGRVERVFL